MNRTGNMTKAAVFLLLAAIGGTIYMELSKPRKTAGVPEAPSPEFAVHRDSAAAAQDSAVQPSSGTVLQTAAQLSPGTAEADARPPDTQSQPSNLIETLLSVRFNEEPGGAFMEGDWKTDLSESYNHNHDARSFYKSGSADEIRLYSYTVPSLEQYRELIMAGYARICKEPNQDTAAGILESLGFTVSAPEENTSGFGAANWQGALKAEKGDVSGFVYYELYKGKRCLKTVVSHKDVSKYGHLPRISKSFFYDSGLPSRLKEELETYGVAALPGNDWAEIKNLSKGPEKVPPEKLISAYNSVKPEQAEAGKKPALILFRDYLVDYLFDSVNSEARELFRKTLKDSPPSSLKLLEESGIPYGYDREKGNYYSPEAFSVRLYEEYPESFWGQYVFVKQMAAGFPEAPFTSKLLSEKVMRKGELFLMRNSTSPFITDVLFLLGKAYETSYTAGLSLNSYSGYLCDNTDCAKLLQKNEEYRLNALNLYKEILNRPDRGKYEEFLRYTIPRLETKSKTYCRFYLNIYDQP